MLRATHTLAHGRRGPWLTNTTRTRHSIDEISSRRPAPGVTAAAVMMTPREAALAQEAAQKAALDRIAANTYPIRPLFKSAPFRGAPRPAGASARSPAAAAAPARRGYSAEAAALTQNPNATAPLAVANAATAARANLPNAAADEGEVRRDHDAGLPAVHEGHVPRRDAHGPVLGPLRRRHRRDDVLPRGQRAARRVRSDEPVGPEVAREARQHAGQDRHEGAAHLEQRADRTSPTTARPRTTRKRKAGVDDGASAGSRAARCSA